MSFLGLSRESTGRAFNALRCAQYAQTGRSMVEMLGVLAVIGVLSVGGVAGYTKAMNKHRANEILNEASKRSVLAAGQLLTNPTATTISLSQFGTASVAGATFGTTASIADGKITLTVSGVETAICNQMRTAAGTNSVMQINTDCTTLTFNSNMSKGEGSSSEWSIDTGSCTTGNVYLSYETDPCGSTTNAKKGDTGMECVKNSDCGSGEYCDFTGIWGNNCSVIKSSTCKTLDAGTSTTYENGSDKQTFLVSSYTMSRWAAENWCKAHHKSLVSYSTVKSLSDCNSRSSFSKFTDSSYWSNGTLPDSYWTAEPYDSCTGWGLNVVGADFSKFTRYNGRCHALCE